VASIHNDPLPRTTLVSKELAATNPSTSPRCSTRAALPEGRPIPLTEIVYGSDEWKRLYRGRSAVEREFGRLKNEYALTPLRELGIGHVRIHADLTLLARLGQAPVRVRAVPLAG
jgi:hypothetical protein